MSNIINSVGLPSASATTPLTQSISMGKDDFLKLLIAQLKNQDPMSPLESQDFAAQLAQFTTLEKLNNIDHNIETGIQVDMMMTQAINNTMAANIIGKDARGFGDQVVMNDDGTGQLSFRLGSLASEVTAKIMDESGNVVRRINLKNCSKEFHQIDWDGKDDNGQNVNGRKFTFEISATDANGKEVYVQKLITGFVTGIRYEEGRAILLINDLEVQFANVLEIGVKRDG